MSSIKLSCPCDLYAKTNTQRKQWSPIHKKKYSFDLVILMIHSGLTNISRNELTGSVRAIMNQHLTHRKSSLLSAISFSEAIFMY